MCFTSFHFLLDINIALDFSSLKPTLFSFDHAVILLISTFEKFSVSLIVSPLVISSRSSANATTFVVLVYYRFSKELYWMFQNPGPQHDPCGHPLVTSLCSLMLLVDRMAERWLK